MLTALIIRYYAFYTAKTFSIFNQVYVLASASSKFQGRANTYYFATNSGRKVGIL